MNLNHPILEQSFGIIDERIGEHRLSNAEYAIARRIIHSTADFDFLKLLRCSENAIATGISYLKSKKPIVTDVSMVREGIKTMVNKTFKNEIIVAVEQAEFPKTGETRTENGLLTCSAQYPEALYVIGNAPTALLRLCQQIRDTKVKPSLVIGVPVGFVSVLEAKEALANLEIPQIRIEGNKGGSNVAAAIINALLALSFTESNEW
jgi:precorrin-8X/cobalt-precorrin-8 methylmutase